MCTNQSHLCVCVCFNSEPQVLTVVFPQDQKQTDSIQMLQSQLEDVTKLMLNLTATVSQLQREVTHLLLTSSPHHNDRFGTLILMFGQEQSMSYTLDHELSEEQIIQRTYRKQTDQ